MDKSRTYKWYIRLTSLIVRFALVGIIVRLTVMCLPTGKAAEKANAGGWFTYLVIAFILLAVWVGFRMLFAQKWALWFDEKVNTILTKFFPQINGMQDAEFKQSDYNHQTGAGRWPEWLGRK